MHRDFKWVAAVAFVLCAVAASLTYSLYRITAYAPATGAAAAVISGLAAGAIDQETFAQLQAAAAANPQAEVQAGEVRLPLRGQEILGLSKEQALDKAGHKLAHILYYEGVEAAEPYFQDSTGSDGEATAAGPPPDEGDKGLKLDPLALFSQGTHAGVRPFALGFSLAALALLALLILFSRGFGRLGSPGLALLVAVGPAALATQVLKSVSADVGDDEGEIFPQAAAALQPTLEDLARLFTMVVAIGAGLTVLALAGNMAAVLWRRLRRRAAQPLAGEPPRPGTEPGAAEPEGASEYALYEPQSIARGGDLPSLWPYGLFEA